MLPLLTYRNLELQVATIFAISRRQRAKGSFRAPPLADNLRRLTCILVPSNPRAADNSPPLFIIRSKQKVPFHNDRSTERVATDLQIGDKNQGVPEATTRPPCVGVSPGKLRLLHPPFPLDTSTQQHLAHTNAAR